MRTLCMGNTWATVHVTSLCCDFNSFLWMQRQLAICGEVGHPHGDMRGGMPLTWRDAGPPPTWTITCDLGGGRSARKSWPRTTELS